MFFFAKRIVLSWEGRRKNQQLYEFRISFSYRQVPSFVRVWKHPSFIVGHSNLSVFREGYYKYFFRRTATDICGYRLIRQIAKYFRNSLSDLF